MLPVPGEARPGEVLGVGAARRGSRLHELRFGPVAGDSSRSPRRLLHVVGDSGATDDPGHERLTSLADVLLDLDGEDLDPDEVLVEELHDALQLGRDDIGDEEEPELAGREVTRGPLPELIDGVGRLGLGAMAGQPRSWRTSSSGVAPSGRGRSSKSCRSCCARPVRDDVGRVVEHLADDLAADAGVGAALHLDERRDRVLVDEEVVERPPGPAALGIGDAGLAGDEEPAARLARSHLVAGEEVRVVREELLEDRLKEVALL